MNFSRNPQNQTKGIQLLVYGIYIYAFSLPLPLKISSITLILLVAIWLYTVFKGLGPLLPVPIPFLLKIVFAYFILLSISLLFSTNKAQALDYLVLQITILLLPIILHKTLKPNQFRVTLILFCLGTFISTWVALYKTYSFHFNWLPLTIQNLKTADWAYFSYILPESVQINAPYFSFYSSFSFIISAYLATKYYLYKRKPYTLLLFVFPAYFLGFAGILSSRSSLVFTIVVFSFFTILFNLKNKKRTLYAVVLSGVMLFCGTMLYQNIPYLKSKIDNWNGYGERVEMWTNGVQIISKYPIMGVGVGDNQLTTLAMYEKNNFQKGLEEKLNMHNQYLDSTISLGVVGVSLLLLLFGSSVFESWQRKDFLALSFICIYALCCFTESMLQGRAGVLIFSFLWSLLFFGNTNVQNAQGKI